jgi:hypothetical protein
LVSSPAFASGVLAAIAATTATAEAICWIVMGGTPPMVIVGFGRPEMDGVHDAPACLARSGRPGPSAQ